MAKDAKDKTSDAPTVFTPATKDEFIGAINEIAALKKQSKVPGEKIKDLLAKFNEQHSVPPWIFKIGLAFYNLEQDDHIAAARAKRALIHMLDSVGVGRQGDIEDITGSANDDGGDDPETDGPKGYSSSDEEWAEAAPGEKDAA